MYEFGDDFWFPGARMRIEREDNDLIKHSKGQAITLIPQSESTMIDRANWALITFRKDGQGNIVDLVWRYDNKDYILRKVSE
jgi:hypothetical protein